MLICPAEKFQKIPLKRKISQRFSLERYSFLHTLNLFARDFGGLGKVKDEKTDFIPEANKRPLIYFTESTHIKFLVSLEYQRQPISLKHEQLFLISNTTTKILVTLEGHKLIQSLYSHSTMVCTST